MSDFKRLAHAVWEYEYHGVWCPKYRFRILDRELKISLRRIVRQLCEWKKVEILEDNVQMGHIHLVI
jgi:putative transposase